MKYTLGRKSDKFGPIELVQTTQNSCKFFTKDGELFFRNFDDTFGRAVHHRDNYMGSTQGGRKSITTNISRLRGLRGLLLVDFKIFMLPKAARSFGA